MTSVIAVDKTGKSTIVTKAWSRHDDITTTVGAAKLHPSEEESMAPAIAKMNRTGTHP
ncbi:MAG: hypothetical protein VXW49_12465 [Pseudomonadota bacterium]|nr:hypothetical protein [Pseudomonadota bacterium]